MLISSIIRLLQNMRTLFDGFKGEGAEDIDYNAFVTRILDEDYKPEVCVQLLYHSSCARDHF